MRGGPALVVMATTVPPEGAPAQPEKEEVPTGGKMVITVDPRDLDPGEYLRFKAWAREWHASVGRAVAVLIHGKMITLDLGEDAHPALVKRVDKLDADCLAMKATVSHIDLFREPYHDSGGKQEDWTDYKRVLAEMARRVPAILKVGETCGACNEKVGEGHLDMDFQRFAAYIKMRRDYQEAKEKVVAAFEVMVNRLTP